MNTNATKPTPATPQRIPPPGPEASLDDLYLFAQQSPYAAAIEILLMRGDRARLVKALRDARECFRDQAERDGGALHRKANNAYESIDALLRSLGEDA